MKELRPELIATYQGGGVGWGGWGGCTTGLAALGGSGLGVVHKEFSSSSS
jgi:hypothetical protein